MLQLALMGYCVPSLSLPASQLELQFGSHFLPLGPEAPARARTAGLLWKPERQK